MKNNGPNVLARALRGFLGDYLPGLRGMSSHTIKSYRDALVLLLRFVACAQDIDAVCLDLDHLEPKVVIAFLAYLEKERHNTVATRNVRLAAIHAFFRYVAAYYPERLEQAQQVLGIPFKRAVTKPVDYLEYDEIRAVLDSVDRSTLYGRRDYALLVLLFNTGARVQEILDLRASHLQLVRPFHVRLCGKGRKVRICPLWPQTAAVIRDYCAEWCIELRSDQPVFLNHRGEPFTRFGVRYILAKYCEQAQAICPSLGRKKLHPHSLRHSTAIYLLKSGVDLVTVSHWLGHASINTTYRYTAIDLEMKRAAIGRAKLPDPHPQMPGAWQSDAAILEWLKSL
jgi:site-specific recombinase XerD